MDLFYVIAIGGITIIVFGFYLPFEQVLCKNLWKKVQLDANNGGPMGPGNSEGLQVGTRLQACSTQATSTTHHERKALTQTEIEKMVTKGAIVPVAPCDREIFLLDCYAF